MSMIKNYPGTRFPSVGSNYTFQELYPDADTFLADYKACEFPAIISDENVKILYFTLLARKGEDCIQSESVGMFKYKMFLLIWQYGPSWEAKLNIQRKMQEFTEDDILDGGTQIYNQGVNPSTPIGKDGEQHQGTLSKNELNYVQQQSVTLNTRNKTNAYRNYQDMLKNDVSEQFFSKFDKLFAFVYAPGITYFNEID